MDDQAAASRVKDVEGNHTLPTFKRANRSCLVLVLDHMEVASRQLDYLGMVLCSAERRRTDCQGLIKYYLEVVDTCLYAKNGPCIAVVVIPGVIAMSCPLPAVPARPSCAIAAHG